ncbi:hypothetical protein K439DRAFT_1338710, partial [Ramaria rubella]
FLPSYSPNYNPIELTFSAIKAHIKHEGNIVCTVWNQEDNFEVYGHLFKAIYSVTSDDAHTCDILS